MTSSSSSQTTGVETVTASGSKLSDATSVTQNNVLIVSESNLRGIRLMIPKAGQRLFLRNISANSCKIYPQDKHRIDGQTNPIVLGAGVGNILLGVDTTNWITMNIQ